MNMLLKNRERIRDEKIDGKIFDMSPAPSYQHSVVNGRIFSKISNGLKDSMCLVFMENIDYKYSKENDNYLEPDIIICCDRNQIKRKFLLRYSEICDRNHKPIDGKTRQRH